jgi:hypothetical protein
VRSLVERRWSSGLLAAAMICFLTVQGLAAAIAQGGAASTLRDPSFVICSGSADHGDRNDPTAPVGDDDPHIFCAVLCQLSFARTAALPSTVPVIERLDLSHEVVAADGVPLPGRRYEQPHVAEARAPPLAS